MNGCAVARTCARTSAIALARSSKACPRLQRYSSSAAAAWSTNVAQRKVQVYISKLDDPFVNLSIEHYLLQKSRKDASVLFLYVNRPSIVIGRNQNPWLEVNLQQIRQPKNVYTWSPDGKRIPTARASIDLVRRRSGGGTVFHDGGNVNYCVISPNSTFTRDKHAEMVVRAIRNGINPRARVNERHDIVLDQGDAADADFKPNDMHRTPFENTTKKALKASGSAYKMIRDRTLHHGTCLVNSPNLTQISGFLRSPGAAYIQALGVDSVRTPVTNIWNEWHSDAIRQFQRKVVEQFLTLYDANSDTPQTSRDIINGQQITLVRELDEEHIDIPEIQKGIAELRSLDWIYGQTPRFTVCSESSKQSSAASNSWPSSLPTVYLESRHGIIEQAKIGSLMVEYLVGRKIHEIRDFTALEPLSPSSLDNHGAKFELMQNAGRWLNNVFAVKCG